MIYLQLFLLNLAHHGSAVCSKPGLDQPLAAQDGDYIIAGIFDLGEVKIRNETDSNGAVVEVEYCSHDSTGVYGVQRALAMRKTIEQEQERFRDINKTLGYAIYDACGSSAVTARVSIDIANNEKVIGVSGVDLKSLVKRSAMITTSHNIPTFTYLYNDEDLVTEKFYPTLFSMIDTEEIEAQIIINFVQKMKYSYMDIWYHEFSEDMAKYIYDNHLSKEGSCGRMQEVTDIEKVPQLISELYNRTGGTPSQVQLILSNSNLTTKEIMRHMLEDLEFKDKIYILGISNGRKKYVESYVDVFKEFPGSGINTIIFPIAPLLNANLETLNEQLARRWTETKDEVDELYKEIQEKKCQTTNSSTDEESVHCLQISSWLAYVTGGVKIMLQSLYETLMIGEESSCVADFRGKVFNSIVEEKRNFSATLDENVSFDIHFHNRTVHLDYEIGVYQTANAEAYKILGTLGPEFIEIIDEDLLNQISYNETCSVTCTAGYYRLFDDSQIAHLPCCWNCTKCPSNTFTTDENENACKDCNIREASNDSNTACVHVSDMYIDSSSYIFIGALIIVLSGILLVFAVGAMIVKNVKRPVIMASDPVYLYVVLFGIAMGMTTSIIPLFKPSSMTCTAEYCCFIGFMTIITSNLVWKCVKIYGIFSAADEFRKPRFVGLLNRAGQVLLNGASLLFVVILAIIDRIAMGKTAWRPNEIQLLNHTSVYLVCESNTFQTVIPLVVPCVYFVVTLTLAFKMRNFPHNFKETLNIFVATLIVLLCCIMFLSGYSLSHPYFRSLLRTIVIFVFCIAFLFCLFLPKILVVLCRHVDIEAEKGRINESLRDFSGKRKDHHSF